MDTLNCPQCGAELPLSFRFAKLVVCPHCGSTIFLEDDAARLAGERSALVELPSLVQLKVPFRYRHASYLPVGHIRYRHAFGYWDEWWLLDDGGQGVWLSVDEGDYAFEHLLPLETSPDFRRLKLDDELKLNDREWHITELDKACCEGFEGELPEVVRVGETFLYAHLSGRDGELMTLEYLGNSVRAYAGKWVDPFDVRREA